MGDLHYYEDKDCTIEVNKIWWDTVMAGEVGDVTVYVKNVNDKNYYTDFRYTPSDACISAGVNVQVLEQPTRLGPLESQPLSLRWKPPLKLKDALQCPLKLWVIKNIPPEVSDAN